MTQRPPGGIDVHQHLWPPEFIERLRRRATPPMLRGWTLHTAYEAPYDVDAAAHDVELRRASDIDRALVALAMSTPLGVEALPPDDAQPLLAAWHTGVAGLGGPFVGWAVASTREPELAHLDRLLRTHGIVGLQVGSHSMDTPASLEALAPLLRRAELADRPVLVHPGPVDPHPGPDWWPAVVQYPAAQQAAWWSWQTVGRSLLPDLRICFVAGAGLAPLSIERFAVRARAVARADDDLFVDTSSYGRLGVDALRTALGARTIVLGSDRPYAEPFDLIADPHLSDAEMRAYCHDNPARLLGVAPN
ncbi:amidohydrolase family protein [Allobranchiibius sp. GilTou38]|uniref:amidohydrolase family protein n=1 Tax=Allobranchiibius sp. GilTou38 TaxID=2815210 RepID=UPI001AA1CDC9|nr:amidohydrolase family protein [Allobranchiibius sp. GilTou38]MBO1768402.1 amidohydrolase family protein [Allobranchiibius sp. GilTou38]